MDADATRNAALEGARPESPWVQIPLFRGLGEEDLGVIAGCLVRRRFAAGEVLIRQGVWRGELFIIRTGVVEISLRAADDERGVVSLRRLVSGDCIGEMSLMTGALPSATARALTDGEAWVLGAEDFRRLAQAQPELSRNVSAILSERLAHTSRQQLGDEAAQIIVVVGTDPALPHALAAALPQLSARPALFVDLASTAAARAEEGAPVFALADLLGGRLRAGSATAARGALTVVRDPAGDEAAAGDLSAALGRLGAAYPYVLVALPHDHPALTPQLLAYATRIIVAGRVAELPRLRAGLVGLPIPETAREAVSVVLVDAPAGLRPTVAALELLSEELGVLVQAVLPAAPDGDLTEAAQPVARWLLKQRIGLALGAGGAKGFAHLGAVRLLRRAGIPFDAVTGASVGAIIAAGVAMGMPDEQIEWSLLGGARRVFRPRLPLHGLFGNQALAAWLQHERVFGQRLIEDLTVPYAASAADLTEGREIVVRRGPIWQATLASAAIPGIYPPVRIGRHWLVDGGVVDPVPVSVAQVLGADVVIAVDLSEPLAPRQEPDLDGRAAPRPPMLYANILRARDIMMSEIRAHTVGEPSVLIKPQVKGIDLRKFSEGTQFVEAGEAAAEAVLPQLREKLPWLGRGMNGAG